MTMKIKGCMIALFCFGRKEEDFHGGWLLKA
jgi:hypothetical protein